MKPSYRLLARAYATCERFIFWDALQRCRSAFIKDLPQRCLSIGEGDGRFAEALLKAHPDAQLEIVEPDEAMRKVARQRIPNLSFVQLAEAKPCDVVVLNFVLDLFNEDEAHRFLDQLPDHEIIIVGDFFPEEVEGKIPRKLAGTLIWIMYRFFALTTGLETKELPPTRRILESRDWTCIREQIQWGGFLRAQYWERHTPTTKKTLTQ